MKDKEVKVLLFVLLSQQRIVVLKDQTNFRKMLHCFAFLDFLALKFTLVSTKPFNLFNYGLFKL